MNVVGKILVILNLLVALVVAFFIVIVWRTSTNWKAAAEQRDREIKSQAVSLDTAKETLTLERKKRLEAEKKLEAGDKGSLKDIDDLKGQMVALKEAREVADQKALAADARATQLEKERKLYIDQAADRLKVIEEREAVIAKLNKDYAELKKAETYLIEIRDRLQLRTESLQAEYRKQGEKIEQLLAAGAGGAGGGGSGTVMANSSPKKPNDPNPPAKEVHGKIQRVLKDDPSLVQVDVGLEHGVDKNNTLEVYRVNPPEYIGMIRILDADFHTARARLIRPPFSQPKTIREGDQVVSSLEYVKTK